METNDNRGNEAVAMITKLVTGGGKSFKPLLRIIRYKVVNIN
ncbi:MAG TPA: hypothetical protein VE818_09235 [Nitrososphaeraceae archaeon]|nr:hypothetical protein [Nitrososphaeraceae archaeon]